jgi:hypothetical protein
MRMAHSWIVLWQNEPTASQDPVKKIAAPGSDPNQFLPVSSVLYIAQKKRQGRRQISCRRRSQERRGTVAHRPQVVGFRSGIARLYCEQWSRRVS